MTTLTRYVNSHGQPLALGKELGRGGEGSVYEVNPNIVAKIYHHSLEKRRQEKLHAMIQGSNDSFRKFPLGRLMYYENKIVLIFAAF